MALKAMRNGKLNKKEQQLFDEAYERWGKRLDYLKRANREATRITAVDLAITINACDDDLHDRLRGKGRATSRRTSGLPPLARRRP